MHYPTSFKDVNITQAHITDILYDYEEEKSNGYFVFLSDLTSFPASSGSPILNYNNNKVIGLLRGASKERKIGEQNNHEKNKSAIIIKEGINQFKEFMSKQNNLNYLSPYSYSDTIDIIYYLPNDNKIKLFGTEFVERYKMKEACKIIHNGIEYPLSEYFLINNDNNQKECLKIKLKDVSIMTDLSYMFRFVDNLLSIPNISKMDTSKVENMRAMFERCEKLVELKGINRWNVENVFSMRDMFYDCSKLKYLSEIDEWNPINLKKCNEMFYGCDSLPNSEASKIEKWENINPNIIKGAFNGYIFGKRKTIILHNLTQLDKVIDYLKNNISNFK